MERLKVVAIPTDARRTWHGPPTNVAISRRAVLPTVILALTLIAPTSYAASPEQARPDPVATRAERTALGLPADDQTVNAIAGTPADVGTPEWGIVMTAAEAARIDLPGRAEFSRRVREDVLPYAMAQPGFAGAYFESAAGGGLIIALVAPDRASEQAIASRMPARSKGLGFVYRAITERALRAALKRTETVWDELLPDLRLNRAGVDVSAGHLFLEVDPAAIPQVRRFENALASALAVPIDIRAAVAGVDTACSRDNCVNPLRAGARIYKGAVHSLPPDCTMAFHVTYWVTQHEQFVTAGHCGYGGSNSWLHPGLPGNHVIGTEQATLYTNDGQDVMRVSMADAQASHLLIGDARVYQGVSYPIEGITVCDSRGMQNVIDCGTVTDSYVRWYSNIGSRYVYGGATSGISQVFADSGSPLYERASATEAWAVGVVAQSNGNFAILQDAQGLLQFEIYAP